MAYAYLTMLDIAKSNGSDQAVGLIEENLNSAPELAVLPARAISGTSFKTLTRTAYPSGGFRRANEGVEPVKSTYVNKTYETYYYDLQLEVDNAVATADEQGADHALSLEADGAARGYLLDLGTQMWYGTGSSGDALGFPGAINVYDSSLEVDAGGTTASTASSIWAVVARPKFFELIFGRNTALAVGDWRKQTITRSSKELTAWKNSLEGWAGSAFYSKYAVGRIRDITEDSGKGATDTLISNLLQKFPVGVKPTHLFMSRRSAGQLQRSRTITINSGPGSAKAAGSVELVAPMPESAFGIPIIVTDSILDTESLS